MLVVALDDQPRSATAAARGQNRDAMLSPSTHSDHVHASTPATEASLAALLSPNPVVGSMASNAVGSMVYRKGLFVVGNFACKREQ